MKEEEEKKEKKEIGKINKDMIYIDVSKIASELCY